MVETGKANGGVCMQGSRQVKNVGFPRENFLRIVSPRYHNAVRATSAAAIRPERGSVADALNNQDESLQARRGYVPSFGNYFAFVEDVEN